MRARLQSYVKSLRFRILLIVLLCGLLPVTVLGGYIGAFFLAPLRAGTLDRLADSALQAQGRVQAQIEAALISAKSVTYDGTLERTAMQLREGRIAYQYFYRECKQYLGAKFLRSPFFRYGVFFLLDQPDQLIYTTTVGTFPSFFSRDALPTLLAKADAMDTRSLFFSVGNELLLARKLYNQRLEPFGMIVWSMDPRTLFSPLYEPDRLWGDRVDVRLDEYVAQAIAQEDTTWWNDAELGIAESPTEFLFTGGAATRDYALTYRLHVSRQAVYGQIDRFMALLALLVFLLLLVILGTMWFIHRRFSQPVRALAQAAERLEAGELGITVSASQRDELGRLGQSFNRMSIELHNLVEHAYREELILRDARIEALQSRINPHFLNNTLEIMNWQARMEGSESISRMIDALGTLLDASMDRSNRRVVSLHEELDCAKAYLYLIKLRYGERLAVNWEVDQALLERTAPRLVIQTLLENAIEHGIAPMSRGHLTVRIYQAEDALHIEVVNDGKRISADDQQRINALLASPEDTDLRSEHLGIRNIQQRLKLIYSARAELILRADEHGDTMARISIPIEQIP